MSAGHRLEKGGDQVGVSVYLLCRRELQAGGGVEAE